MPTLELYPMKRGKRAEKPVATASAGVINGTYRVQVPKAGTYEIVVKEGDSLRSHGEKKIGGGEQFVVLQ